MLLILESVNLLNFRVTMDCRCVDLDVKLVQMQNIRMLPALSPAIMSCVQYNACQLLFHFLINNFTNILKETLFKFVYKIVMFTVFLIITE
jgi:hypothetical protein